MSTFEETKELVQYATFDAADPTGDLQRKVDQYVWEHLPLTDARKKNSLGSWVLRALADLTLSYVLLRALRWSDCPKQ
jgi:hypothetical protein